MTQINNAVYIATVHETAKHLTVFSVSKSSVLTKPEVRLLKVYVRMHVRIK